MEILIPGLILVALMVYASTKIKRSAARAYEEEKIDHERFSLIKPEGFIEPIRSEAEPAFLAYTKDFGVDEAADIRIATAEVRIYQDSSISRRREAIASLGIEIKTDRSFQLGPLPALQIVADRDENGAAIDIYYLLVGKNGDVLELKTELLRSYEEEYRKRVEKILDSFELK